MSAEDDFNEIMSQCASAEAVAAFNRVYARHHRLCAALRELDELPVKELSAGVDSTMRPVSYMAYSAYDVQRIVRAEFDPSTIAVENLCDRVESLEEQLAEAKQGPWPEWAEKLLRLLESWGAEYEADDEIALPDELAEWLHHYASELKRAAAAKRTSQAPTE